MSSKPDEKEAGSGFLLPKSSLDVESGWTCRKCGRTKTGNEIKTLIDDVVREVDACDGGGEHDGGGDHEAELFKVLQKFRKFFHPSHQILTEIRYKLIPTYCRAARKKLDDFPGLNRILNFRILIILGFNVLRQHNDDDHF